MEWLAAIALKPVVLFVLLIPAVIIRVLIQRKMPDGKWKRLLLREVSEQACREPPAGVGQQGEGFRR